jgi:hypothetical protein
MPLTASTKWQVAFGGLLVGTTEITLTSSKYVIFDSGSSLTYVPSNEYRAIIAEIKKNQDCNIAA